MSVSKKTLKKTPRKTWKYEVKEERIIPEDKSCSCVFKTSGKVKGIQTLRKAYNIPEETSKRRSSIKNNKGIKSPYAICNKNIKVDSKMSCLYSKEYLESLSLEELENFVLGQNIIESKKKPSTPKRYPLLIESGYHNLITPESRKRFLVNWIHKYNELSLKKLPLKTLSKKSYLLKTLPKETTRKATTISKKSLGQQQQQQGPLTRSRALSEGIIL